MFGNRIDYARRGWILDAEAEIEYRSHYYGWQCGYPNAWYSAMAHNAAGETAKIWWYIPISRRGDDVLPEDSVPNWNKCNDIEAVGY